MSMLVSTRTHMPTPMSVATQAVVRGWSVRENWPQLVGSKQMFEFPRRLEERCHCDAWCAVIGP